MLGYIWGAMLIVSLICSIYTGKMEELSSAALNGAAQAIELTLSFFGSNGSLVRAYENC